MCSHIKSLSSPRNGEGSRLVTKFRRRRSSRAPSHADPYQVHPEPTSSVHEGLSNTTCSQRDNPRLSKQRNPSFPTMTSPTWLGRLGHRRLLVQHRGEYEYPRFHARASVKITPVLRVHAKASSYCSVGTLTGEACSLGQGERQRTSNTGCAKDATRKRAGLRSKTL